MKKLMIVSFIAAILPAFAQTRVGEIPIRAYDLCGIPGEFVSSGQSQPVGLSSHYSNNSITNSLFFYNSNFESFKTIVILDTDSLRYDAEVRYIDLDDCRVEYVPITQTLFNNDEQWEYVMEKRELFTTVGCKVVQEDGTVLFTTENEVDGQGNSMEVDGIFIVKLHGNYYLAVSYGFDKTVLYQINHQTQSIKRIDAELPFNVFPSIADRSQEITIELGEGSNATEISVIDANGRVLETIPVQAGQREIKVPASTMGHGLNLLNAHDRQRQATRKIIVK